jgi:hypothetical protein
MLRTLVGWFEFHGQKPFRVAHCSTLLFCLLSFSDSSQYASSFASWGGAFTATQKVEYRDVLSRLRDLIHDLEQDTAREQLAALAVNQWSGWLSIDVSN